MRFPNEINTPLKVGDKPWAILWIVKQVAGFNCAIEHLLKLVGKAGTAIAVMGGTIWRSSAARILEPTMNEGVCLLISLLANVQIMSHIGSQSGSFRCGMHCRPSAVVIL